MIEPLTKSDATAELMQAAFTITRTHCETCTCDVPPDRQIVHCMMGGMGADHDLELVLAHVQDADEIGWIDSLFGHNLAVRVGDRVYHYDVRRPERRE